MFLSRTISLSLCVKMCSYRFIYIKLRFALISLFVPTVLFSSVTPFFNQGSLSSLKSLNSTFVGREKELRDLNKDINKNGAIVKVLMGFPGMGKTSLARQFIIDNHAKYEGILWLDGGRDIKEQLLEFAFKWNNLNKSDVIQNYFLNPFYITNVLSDWIPKRIHSWLIVLDNFNDSNQTRQIVDNLAEAKNVYVIITTKNSYLTQAEKISLTKLSREDSIQILKYYMEEENVKTINYLAEVLGDYPLALKHAGVVFKSNLVLDVLKLIDMFEYKKKIFNSLEACVAKNHSDCDYKNTVENIINITLENLKERSPISYEALKAITFIDIKKISTDILEDWLAETGQDKEKVHEIIFNLTSLFLLDQREIGKASYELHNVIASIVNGTITNEEKSKYIECWCQIFNNKFYVESYLLEEIVSKKRQVYEHAKSIARYAIESNHITSKITELKVHLLYMAYFSAYDRELTSIFLKDIKKYILKNRQLNDFILGRYYIVLSNSLSTINISQAIKESEKAIALLRPLNEHKATVEIFFAITNNLVDFYIARGELSKAENLIQEAQSYISKFSYPAYDISFYCAKGLILMNNGEFEDALFYLDKAIKLVKDNNLYENIYLFIKVTKIETLLHLKKYKEAMDLGELTLEAMTKFFPSMNMYLPLKVKALMVYSSLQLGVRDNLLHNIKQIISAYNGLSGTQAAYPMQAISHMILGDVYMANNQYKEAYKAYTDSFLIFNKIFNKKEVIDISDLYIRFIKNFIMLNDEENAALYFHKQIDEFGSDHINTRQLIEYLDKNNIRMP